MCLDGYMYVFLVDDMYYSCIYMNSWLIPRSKPAPFGIEIEIDSTDQVPNIDLHFRLTRRVGTWMTSEVNSLIYGSNIMSWQIYEPSVFWHLPSLQPFVVQIPIVDREIDVHCSTSKVIMVYLRDSKRVRAENGGSEPTHKPNNAKRKETAPVDSEDKENKKPKMEDSLGSPAPVGKVNLQTKTEKSSVKESGDSAPKEFPIPSVEQKIENRKPEKLANSFLETWCEEDDPAEETRDRRPTPGRNHAAVKDPRVRDNLSDDPDLISREIAKLDDLIAKAPRRRGPKSAYLKDLEFKRETWLDPNEHFHPIYVCFAKGPKGSATYDENGFELDYQKVAEWMKPKSVASVRPTPAKIRRQEARFARLKEEQREMTKIFWEPGAAPKEGDWHQYGDLIRDKVSKDLGIPWHKVWLKEFQEWESRGFAKAKKGEFMTMTAGDRKRYLGLLTGASLRK